MHEGHRKRMMARLRENPESLQDHEVLESLLFFAIPRANTNPLAHQLIWAFGSLDGVFRATEEQLLTVDGVGAHTASLIKCAGEIYRRLPERDAQLPKIFSLNSFSDYIAEHLADLDFECVEFYCIDAAKRVRFRKRYSDFRENAVAVPPEEIGRVLAAQKPAGIVVAHNHPKALAQPSSEDDDFTAKIAVLCSLTNVQFYDHIIVGKNGDKYSYFREGRMERFRETFSVNRLVGGKKQP